MTIYRSVHPNVDLVPSTSIFTFLKRDETPHDTNRIAFIDAVTDEQITRGQVFDLSLRVAHSIKQAGGRRGDVALIFWYALFLSMSPLLTKVCHLELFRLALASNPFPGKHKPQFHCMVIHLPWHHRRWPTRNLCQYSLHPSGTYPSAQGLPRPSDFRAPVALPHYPQNAPGFGTE